MNDNSDDELSNAWIATIVVLAIIDIAMIIIAAIYTFKLKNTGPSWQYPTGIAFSVLTVFMPLFGIGPPIMYASN